MKKMGILREISQNSLAGKKSLAVLIDPDKLTSLKQLNHLIEMGNENYLDYFFIGGSLVTTTNLSEIVSTIAQNSDIKSVLFPGSNIQIDTHADAILFLSLISGRNPEYLIGQHVTAAPLIKSSGLEAISTGYMIINSDLNTSVSYISNTRPIPSDKYTIAAATAMAGEMLGNQLIYLDAGSGGTPISTMMIQEVRKSIKVPLIIGGGIDSPGKAMDAYDAGADLVVIGNAIEKNPDLMIEVLEKVYDFNNSLNIH